MDSIERTRDERSSVEKAVAILKALGVNQQFGLGVSELARLSQTSKSTAFRILGLLDRNGVVRRTGTTYRLESSGFSAPGSAGLSLTDRLRDALTPHLVDLYVATGFTVQLAVWDQDRVLYLNKLESHQRLRSPSRIGGRMPGYSTGVGKVFLAFDPAACETTMKATRKQWTARTIVESTALLHELTHVRTEGIAHDRGESLEGLRCIAAPILGRDGAAVAALSISGQSDVFRPANHEPALRRIAYAAARELERVSWVSAA